MHSRRKCGEEMQTAQDPEQRRAVLRESRWGFPSDPETGSTGDHLQTSVMGTG